MKNLIMVIRDFSHITYIIFTFCAYKLQLKKVVLQYVGIW